METVITDNSKAKNFPSSNTKQILISIMIRTMRTIQNSKGTIIIIFKKITKIGIIKKKTIKIEIKEIELIKKINKTINSRGRVKTKIIMILEKTNHMLKIDKALRQEGLQKMILIILEVIIIKMIIINQIKN